MLSSFSGSHNVLSAFSGKHYVLSSFCGNHYVLLSFSGIHNVLSTFSGNYNVLTSFSDNHNVLSTCSGNHLIKFADDMALVARLKDEQSLSSYFNFIEHLISWFDESYLKLNVKKTKELLIEEHRARDTSLLQPVRIKTEDVESVKIFRYLGTVLDSNLSFTTHVDTVCKKANQRMYLIRKLKTFDVDKKMLEMIYRSLVESILTFNIVTFYNHLTVKQKNRLNKIVNIATNLINLKQKSLNDLYQQAISKKKQKHYK